MLSSFSRSPDRAVAAVTSVLFQLAVVGSAAAQCPPTFAAATYWPVGSPYSVGVGDFNHDGVPDLVGANFSGSNATVRLASLAFPGAYDGPINIPLGLNPRGCGVADFNHDGIDDIAVVYNGGGAINTRLAIIISNGNGSFQSPVLYTTASQPIDLRIADFNSDSNPDIAVVCGCGSISVHMGNANGTFQPYTSHASGSNASGMAIGDYNGDGLLDMFIPSYFGSNIRGVLGVSNAPTFGNLLTHSMGGYFGAYQAATGDFNGDGRDDAAVTYLNTSRVAVQLGNTDGSMTALPGPFAGNQPQDVVAADFNGDGRLDVAVGNWAQSNVSVHLGDGLGGLGNATYFPVALNPNWLVAKDMNNDGKIDLVVACQGAGNIAVLLNSTPVTAFNPVPFSQRVCPGGISTVQFSASATTTQVGGITGYSWQGLIGGVWTNLTNGQMANVGLISGATTQQLTIANVLGQPGDRVISVRAVANTSCGGNPSAPAHLDLIAPCGAADLGGAGGIPTPCGGDGILDNNDFIVFITYFFEANMTADFGVAAGFPGQDGVLDNNDFVAFIDAFFGGCTE